MRKELFPPGLASRGQSHINTWNEMIGILRCRSSVLPMALSGHCTDRRCQLSTLWYRFGAPNCVM